MVNCIKPALEASRLIGLPVIYVNNANRWWPRSTVHSAPFLSARTV